MCHTDVPLPSFTSFKINLPFRNSAINLHYSTIIIYLQYSSVSSAFNTAILVHFIYNCVYSSLFTSINTSFIITAILLHLLHLFSSFILHLIYFTRTSVIIILFLPFSAIKCLFSSETTLNELVIHQRLRMLFLRTNLHDIYMKSSYTNVMLII